MKPESEILAEFCEVNDIEPEVAEGLALYRWTVASVRLSELGWAVWESLPPSIHRLGEALVQRAYRDGRP